MAAASRGVGGHGRKIAHKRGTVVVGFGILAAIDPYHIEAVCFQESAHLILEEAPTAVS